MLHEVAILGSGLSGMLTALALANHGVRSIIIEAFNTKAPKFTQDPRTTAITLASKEFFEKISIWKYLNPIAGKIRDIYVVDNKAPEILHFPAHIAQAEAMGYMLKNSELKSILLRRVEKNELITLRDQQDYEFIDSYNDKAIVYLKGGQKITCSLLIICDGRHSKARREFFASKIDKSYGQSALTFEVEHEAEHEGTAVEHFMPSGPFAILPLRSSHNSSIVWTVKGELSRVLQDLPEAEFEDLVQNNFGEFLGKVKVLEKPSAFPLKACLTDKYYYQRLVLVADTAHIVHPLAGQGLNQGIKDIDALIQLIVANVKCSLPINQVDLEKYQSARSLDNLAMYIITDNINKLFSNNSSTLSHLRRGSLKLLDNMNWLKEPCIKYAMGKR